jgi:hypothetical protein
MLRTQILDLESLDKMRRNNHMFGNLMEQILLRVASQYVPKLQNIACTRANELTVMKEKIQHLQAKWFDKEIEKLRNVSMSDLIRKLNRE